MCVLCRSCDCIIFFTRSSSYFRRTFVVFTTKKYDLILNTCLVMKAFFLNSYKKLKHPNNIYFSRQLHGLKLTCIWWTGNLINKYNLFVWLNVTFWMGYNWDQLWSTKCLFDSYTSLKIKVDQSYSYMLQYCDSYSPLLYKIRTPLLRLYTLCICQTLCYLIFDYDIY